MLNKFNLLKFLFLLRKENYARRILYFRSIFLQLQSICFAWGLVEGVVCDELEVAFFGDSLGGYVCGVSCQQQ